MASLGPDGLRGLLSQFMASYLPLLNMGRQDVFAVLDGVSFMPMERTAWLQAQSLINEAEQSFPELDKCALFFKENLMASSLDLASLRPLCRYLFHFPPHRSQIRQEGVSGGALLGLSHRNSPVYVGGKPCHLLVFKLTDLTVALLLSSLSNNVDEVVRFFKVGVQQFVPEMQRNFLAFDSAESVYRFVYYNGVNWALKGQKKKKVYVFFFWYVFLKNYMNSGNGGI